MDKQKLQIGEGRGNVDKRLGGLTAAQVLQRYKDEDLPAFCGIKLTDVNQPGLFGERPLDVAAVRGNLNEIRALLEGGADLNARAENGNTPLHEATGQGSVEAVKLLLEFGAKTDVRNEFGQTALDIASLRDREEIMVLLRAKSSS
jgi:ankyrin repeat protein